MKPEEIIKQKISYLNGDDSHDLTDEMLKQVEKDQTLMQELEFIEQFWDPKTQVEDQLPSSDLSHNFYSMLDKAKTAQQPELKSGGFLLFLENIFQPKAILQFATLMMVFILGYYLNEPKTIEQNNVMASLQKDVKSLNSMVALSMIQKNSASERLTGVAYSKHSNSQDASLTIALIDLLNSDSSTAVRLAVIDAVNTQESVLNLQNQLLESIPEQPNALVQMGLIRLIMERGDETGKKSVLDMKNNHFLIPEVVEYLNQLNLSNNI